MLRYLSRISVSRLTTYSFLWVLNAPTLAENIINEYVEICGNIVCGNLPSEGGAHSYQLVKTFQIHYHSKTCRNI